MTTKSSTSHELPPALRAMADSTRLKILLMLEAKPRTVGEIVTFFDLSQPTITRHLQTLAAAGLVCRIRKGQSVLYKLNTDALRSVCVNLVDCFPCCCVTVKIEQVVEPKEISENFRARRHSFETTNTKSKSKGGKR
jgi:ArsR family transcriptional regulator, arsenate/arsenite/antimonite-responsive transcriptional repressor